MHERRRGAQQTNDVGLERPDRPVICLLEMQDKQGKGFLCKMAKIQAGADAPQLDAMCASERKVLPESSGKHLELEERAFQEGLIKV